MTLDSYFHTWHRTSVGVKKKVQLQGSWQRKKIEKITFFFFSLISESLLCLALADIADLVFTSAPQGKHSSGPRSKPRTIGGLCHHHTQGFKWSAWQPQAVTHFELNSLVTSLSLYFPAAIHHHLPNTGPTQFTLVSKQKNKLQIHATVHFLKEIKINEVVDIWSTALFRAERQHYVRTGVRPDLSRQHSMLPQQKVGQPVCEQPYTLFFWWK